MSEEATLDEFADEETEGDAVDVGSLQQLEKSPIAEWTLKKLGSLLTLEYGDNLPSDSREEGEIPVFGSNGQVGTHSESAVTEPGIIMGRKGSIGEIKFSEIPFWPIDTTYYITANETDENLRFLYYLLQNIQLKRLNAASAIPGLNRNDAYGLNALVPPLSEQRKIATVLYTVDRAIEKTERIVEQMDIVQQGLLRSLFGKDKQGRDTDVETKTERLGPKQFQVPVSWEVTNIASIGRVVTGDTPSTDDESNFGGSLPFVTPNTLSQGKYVTKSDRTLSETGRNEAKPVPEGSVMMDCIGSDMGKVAISGCEVATNQQINSVVIEDASYLPEFLYYHLIVLSDFIKSQAGQTATPIVNKSSFESFVVFNPPIEEQQKIIDTLSLFDKGKQSNIECLTELKRLKRGLQQDLLSGTVRTTDTNIEVPDEIAQHG